MAQRTLEVLPVSAHDPAAILPLLEEAIAGAATFLPIPADDTQRAESLRSSQLAGRPIDRDIALVVGTSGSTGTPKGAQLTPRNLVLSADATHQVLGGPGQWLLAMPAHYIAGLQVLVRSLIAGVDPLCLDLSNGFSIEAFARAAEELAATGDRIYTALTPMQLLKAMDSLQGIDALRVFDRILIGGAPLVPSARMSAERLGIRVVTTYGASETTGGCVYDGSPLPGMTIELAENGRVLLGGAMVAHGYRNAPHDHSFARAGWWATNDVGHFADGSLVVDGRLDAIIDTGGLKLHPEVVESALLCASGVVAAAVIAIPDVRLGQAVVAAVVGDVADEDIYQALGRLPRWQWPKDVKKLSRLPMTATGKVDRVRVARLWG